MSLATHSFDDPSLMTNVLELAHNGNQAKMHRKRMSDHIYDYIVTMIFQKNFRSGQRILESDLVEKLEVSKVSIREALVKLAKDGWVKIKPSQGTFVSDYREPQKLARLYKARLTMELGAFCQLAMSSSEDCFTTLRELVTATENSYQMKDLLRYRIEDLKFHCVAVQAAGGPLLVRQFQNIFMQIFSFVTAPEKPEDFMAIPKEDGLPTSSHRDIMETLESHNISKMIYVVGDHVLSGAVAAGIDVDGSGKMLMQ